MVYGNHGGSSLVISNFKDSFRDISDPMGGLSLDGHLPDNFSTTKLLEALGADRGWTKMEIVTDVQILEQNRLRIVRDLRALNQQSWDGLALVPLVKDLLKAKVRQ
jgi:hypothetical protein